MSSIALSTRAGDSFCKRTPTVRQSHSNEVIIIAISRHGDIVEERAPTAHAASIVAL